MSYSVTVAIYENVGGTDTLKDSGYADFGYGTFTFGDILIAFYQLGVISYVPSGDFEYVNIIYPQGVESLHWDYSTTITIDQTFAFAYHYEAGDMIGATVYFDANGGTVSPSYEHSEHVKTGSTDYTVDIDFPVPTRSGKSFAGWLVTENQQVYSAGTHAMHATTAMPSYHAVAQWTASGNRQTRIYTSSGWVTAQIKIYYDGAWHDASANIT